MLPNSDEETTPTFLYWIYPSWLTMTTVGMLLTSYPGAFDIPKVSLTMGHVIPFSAAYWASSASPSLVSTSMDIIST